MDLYFFISLFLFLSLFSFSSKGYTSNISTTTSKGVAIDQAIEIYHVGPSSLLSTHQCHYHPTLKVFPCFRDLFIMDQAILQVFQRQNSNSYNVMMLNAKLTRISHTLSSFTDLVIFI